MGYGRIFTVTAFNAVAQPTDPSDGAMLHIKKTGAIGAFSDYGDHIAEYTDLVGWIYHYPHAGDRCIVVNQPEVCMHFTPAAGTPAHEWIRKGNMYSYKENDQNLTTAYAVIGDWEPADPYIAPANLGAFTWDTVNGEIEMERGAWGDIRMTWSFNVQQIAAGNQNSFTIKIQKDAGGVGSWVDMDGGFGGGNTFSNASMFYDHVTICVQDSSAAEGDKYRSVIRCESDSADNLLTVADASVCVQEILPW
jgi:hypothetical protein